MISLPIAVCPSDNYFLLTYRQGPVNLTYHINLVDAVGLEPTMHGGGRFTVSWGYQFSYTSKNLLRDAREFYGSFKSEPRGSSPYKNLAMRGRIELPSLDRQSRIMTII